MEENIAALSTAFATAGVAVIRISGDSPLEIAEKMFAPQGKTPVKDFEPYKMYTGTIDGKTFTDYGMCVYFKAPKSYTGENMVEFHCHGGIAIVKGLLRRIYELGARPAERGEFTKRAFVNGKLSLSSAEGLIDMINSESESEVRAGYGLYREKLKKKIDVIQDELTYALAKIDADIDFPEEDLEAVSREEIKETLGKAESELDKILATYRTGRTLKNGVKVAICGKPNAGKSSLLNAILGYEKAIVTSIPGTTRDVVEGSTSINGVKFDFYDTAGIRETSDEVEGIGVSIALKTVKNADLVLFVYSAEDFNKEDEEILSGLNGLNVVKIMNKTDLAGGENNGVILPELKTSAATGAGVEELKRYVFERTVGANIDLGGDFLTEERHYDAIKRAKEKIASAKASVIDMPLDLSSIDIKEAWQYLGEISGKSASEDVINEIFSKFCVGK